MKHSNIVISLDTRRKKSDGTYPLIMRIGHNRTTIPISIGINLHQKDWDEKKRIIKTSYSGADSVTRLNNMLQKKKAEALDMMLKLLEKGELEKLTVADLKARITGVHSTESFIGYAERLVHELYQANRVGTANSYKGVLNILKAYHKGKDIRFSDINYSFLTKFETAHYRKGNGANSLAVYMRTIRAIWNKALKEGITERSQYPFYDYKIKTAPTEKRALELDLLQRIVALQIPQEHICFHARNYFLASYMLYGMNFTDMAYLKKDDIKDGRIVYRRKKTSKIYDIKITPALKHILDFYLKANTDSDYVFPILKRDTALLQNKDIMWARKRYNKKLKLLAELCNINKTLTSYVSRHSFATQAMLQQIPLNAISSMLGHSSIKTTETYLKSLPSNILDEYNEKVLEIF